MAAIRPTAGETASSGHGHEHKAKAGKHAKKRKPLLNFSLNVEKSYALGADQLTPPGTVNDNQVLLGGALDVNLTPRLRAFVSRSNHFSVSGRRYKKGKPDYSGAGWDLEYDGGLSFAASKDLTLLEEYVYRYRVCCPNAGDPRNSKPRILQGPRTQITYLAGPQTRIGRPLRLRAEATYAIHHLDLGFGLPAGTPVLGNTWVSKVSAYLSVPVYGQRQFVPFVGVEHFSDFFDNQRVPSMTNRTEVGFRLRGTPFVSYRAYVKNDHQTNPGGDVSHKVMLYFVTTFKGHS